MPPSKEAITKEKSGGSGFLGSIKEALGIGGGGSGISSAPQRPQARPEYVVQGTGKDAVYQNTQTGKSAAAPSYSPFSMQGLTSNDPGNYMRNQEAAARYAAMPQYANRGQGGIASLVSPVAVAAPVAAPTAPTTSPVVAPTPAPAPVEVPTMGYTGAPAMGAVPAGYGSAFAGLSQPMANPYGGMSLMDIFSMYPDLRYM